MHFHFYLFASAVDWQIIYVPALHFNLFHNFLLEWQKLWTWNMDSKLSFVQMRS